MGALLDFLKSNAQPSDETNEDNELRSMTTKVNSLSSFDSLEARQPHHTSVWGGEEWKTSFDERAAIMEFDGNVPRTLAEARAFQACIADWLNQNPPPPADPDTCAACGRREMPGAAVVPFGTGPHVWLHSACWRSWHRARIADAERTLAAMGVFNEPVSGK